jgi:hypothetical protein
MTPEPHDRPETPPAHETDAGTPPHERGPTELSPDEEPNTTGTLFIMILFLMAMGGLWAMMYFILLNR